jgi:hypothetical protein
MLTATSQAAKSSPKLMVSVTSPHNIIFSPAAGALPYLPLAAIPSTTSWTCSALPASTLRTTASSATTRTSIPEAASTPTPTLARKTTNSKAKNATPKPATTTSAPAPTPAASAVGSAPTGLISLFRPRHPLPHPDLPARSAHFLSAPAPSALRVTAFSHIPCFTLALFWALSCTKSEKLTPLFSNPSALFGKHRGCTGAPTYRTPPYPTVPRYCLKPLLQLAHPYTCTCKKGPAAREPRYSPCAAS